MEVRAHNEGSDLVDPLVDYSNLSLFKQSLNLSSPSPASNSSISDSFHTHLKARVLNSPDKLFKQATTILEGSVDLSQADKTQPVITENEKVPRERRPALGLRRAKFSVKPMPSQPAVNPESSFDFDNLTDPDEYFAAFERMENAKRNCKG
ncbi:Centromere protein C [Bienertia sinuspersici]